MSLYLVGRKRWFAAGRQIRCGRCMERFDSTAYHSEYTALLYCSPECRQWDEQDKARHTQ